MKMKKNIIRKNSHSNKKLYLDFKREVKYILKKRYFKFDKFIALSKYTRYNKSCLKIAKKFKNSFLKTKSQLLIKKYIYINFIGNGLNLKYDELIIQNLYKKTVYSNNFYKTHHVISKFDDLNIIKLHKFLNLIENKLIIYEKLDNYVEDYFIQNYFLFFSIIREYKKLLNNIYLIKLIWKCF